MTARDVIATPFLVVGLAFIGCGIVALVGARQAWRMWR